MFHHLHRSKRGTTCAGDRRWPVTKCDGFGAESLLLRKIDSVTYLLHTSVHLSSELALGFDRVFFPLGTPGSDTRAFSVLNSEKPPISDLKMNEYT